MATSTSTSTLKNRVYRAGSHHHTDHTSTSSTLDHNDRPLKYKEWDSVRMKKAIEDVRAGYSIRRAAADYGIPKSTLADRISGRVIDGTVSGPAKYLSDQCMQKKQN